MYPTLNDITGFQTYLVMKFHLLIDKPKLYADFHHGGEVEEFDLFNLLNMINNMTSFKELFNATNYAILIIFLSELKSMRGRSSSI